MPSISSLSKIAGCDVHVADLYTRHRNQAATTTSPTSATLLLPRATSALPNPPVRNATVLPFRMAPSAGYVLRPGLHGASSRSSFFHCTCRIRSDSTSLICRSSEAMVAMVALGSHRQCQLPIHVRRRTVSFSTSLSPPVSTTPSTVGTAAGAKEPRCSSGCTAVVSCWATSTPPPVVCWS